MKNRAITTKDIGLLYQLYKDNQLRLRPEFQRLSVWPKAAKAYLIDSILNERPIPLFFMQRGMSAQTGRPVFDVIDGQQRLKAIFEFLENDFSLTESKGDSKAKQFNGMKFDELPIETKRTLYNYDLIIEDLFNYSDADIRDMFVRINRFVVKLSKQELRHATEKGKFADFVERLGKWSFWTKHKVFSDKQINRMRSVEFSAELTVLLLEGPQDKKKVIDFYYHTFKDSFGEGTKVESRLKDYLAWFDKGFPELKSSRYRKPVDLYGVIGALDKITRSGEMLDQLDRTRAIGNLRAFEKELAGKPKGDAARYLLSTSRQTDNLAPRTSRIEILASVLTK